MQKIIFLFMLLSCTIGCSKSKDRLAPVITLMAPADNQTFTAGQTVAIAATITDDVELHEVHLFVTNNTTGSEVLHFEDHVDVGTYNLNKTFTAQAAITYKIKIEASDHPGNVAEKQITVKGL